MFNRKQIDFMHKIGLKIDFKNQLSEEDYEEIEEKVSEHLQAHGFDNDYRPTEEGKICESILDDMDS